MPNNENNNPSVDMNAIMAELAALKEENDALKEKNKRSAPSLSCKVGKKGGVSVYGLGRFPVTLYGNQWERLLAFGGTIQEFIAEHASELAVKE